MLAPHLTHGLKLCTDLLEALRLGKINFAHWKGNMHLLDSLTGKTDVELLIKPEDRAAFEEVMEALHFKQAESPSWSRYPHVEDWLGFDEETGSLLHLHTHYSLVISTAYGRYAHLPWLEQFFNHLTIDEVTGWPIPEPEMELLILLIRLQVKGNSTEYQLSQVHEEKMSELLALLKRTDAGRLADCCEALGLQAPEDMEARIASLLQHENLKAAIALSGFFYQQLPASIKEATSRHSFQSLYYKYYLKTLKYYKPFIAPVRLKKRIVSGGKVIAFVGSDGSGKSTLCRDITTWLTYKIDTHYFYLGKQPFIKSYNTRLLSLTDQMAGQSFTSRLLRRMMGDFYHLIIIRQKAQMLRLARHFSNQGSIIICDRLPQKEVFGFNDGPRLQHSKQRQLAQLEITYFEQALQTSADVIFRLHVSPQVAHQRKPEHNLKDIERKCESIKAIRYSAATVIDINADAPYNEVLLEVKRSLWQSFITNER
ncbi:nucleoside/nucleotide kinase family protein [Pontibacter flavimaris]|uniref:Thymidylate kinase n=1 Tax=Pontibacter flavimaris TaxID=1797110 RepID=A0A1Q5PBC8_9BACT|nr:hypothetical protein [Pontibacter flavimaris]OKL39559.1 hypothetical protein A3841_01015 [Pontibacter flavimaris]